MLNSNTSKKIFLFLERREVREKEGERNINVWLPLTLPLLGTCPTTQACALTKNRTGDPLVQRTMLNPLSHTRQGQFLSLESYNFPSTSVFTSLVKFIHRYFILFEAIVNEIIFLIYLSDCSLLV